MVERPPAAWPTGLIAAAVVVVPAAYLFGGAVTVSAAFVVIATVLALFRHEHRALAARSPSTRVRSPLALHDDIATGLGRAVAVAAAAIALVATNALIACGYGAIAAVAGLVASSVLGAEVPWWLLAMPAWLIVTLIGLGRAGRPEAVGQRVLPAVEVVLVVALLGYLLAVAEPGQVGAATPAGGPGAVLVVAVLGLCGFGATLAPCAPGVTPLRPPPPRPVLVSFLLDPRTVVVTAGLLLAGVAWSIGGGAASAGPDTATEPIAGPETILHALDADVGPLLARVVGVVVVGSLLAAALAAHRAGTGHLFVLGHQRLLPAALARTGRRSASPMVASGVQSLLTGAVIAVAAMAGLDPYRHLFVSVGFAGSARRARPGDRDDLGRPGRRRPATGRGGRSRWWRRSRRASPWPGRPSGRTSPSVCPTRTA